MSPRGGRREGRRDESSSGREAIPQNGHRLYGRRRVAYCAGVECRKGDAEGGMQPPTLINFTRRRRDAEIALTLSSTTPRPMIWISCPLRVVRQRNFLIPRVSQNPVIRQGRRRHHIPQLLHDSYHRHGNEDEIWVTMSRVNGTDLTKPESYTFGEMEAVADLPHCRISQRFVPVSKMRDEKVAPFMGIRESRVTQG